MPSLRAYGGCLGLGCVPLPWQHAHGGLLRALALGCMPMGGCCCLGLGCMPWPWLRAMGGSPWPWQHACHGLGCMPWPWPHALALAACLGLGCCLAHKFRVISQKMRVFWKRRLFSPKEAGVGHGRVPRGMPACTPRRIAPHRPALRQNWLVPFPLFVFLNSVHDFRGRFQQAVRRSEQF